MVCILHFMKIRWRFLKPKWRAIVREILFKKGDIVEHGEGAEEEIRW